MDIGLQTSQGMLALMEFKGIGPRTAIRLAKEATVSRFLGGPDAGLRNLIPPSAVQSIGEERQWQEAIEKASCELTKAEKHQIRVISFFDSDFPVLLRSIPDPAAVLYVKGQLRAGVRNVACVGTRRPTYFGVEVANRVARYLAEHDWSIVSGLAAGVDTESHRAALEAKGHTVAVLANGLDTVYPTANKKLAGEIIEKGGALVSEQPVGSRAFPQNLVQRDRLQSGMSVGTFVMQTDVVGGTMHTVRFTLQQGRLLFVPVPPPEYAEEEQSRGIRILAERTGSDLAGILKADGKYRELLRTAFASQPPASPIRNRNEYDEILSRLESFAEKQSFASTLPTSTPV